MNQFRFFTDLRHVADKFKGFRYWLWIYISSLCFFSQGGPELDGIYVKSLLPGGAAEASGKIRNGLSFEKCPRLVWSITWKKGFFSLKIKLIKSRRKKTWNNILPTLRCFLFYAGLRGSDVLSVLNLSVFYLYFMIKRGTLSRFASRMKIYSQIVSAYLLIYGKWLGEL